MLSNKDFLDSPLVLVEDSLALPSALVLPHLVRQYLSRNKCVYSCFFFFGTNQSEIK
jgi:hypothetical protein